MPEAPRRKRFQIHLSTALIMMFAAGALMWANFTPPELVYILPIKEASRSWSLSAEELAVLPFGRQMPQRMTYYPRQFRYKEYGWPVRIFESGEIEFQFIGKPVAKHRYSETVWYYALTIDIIVALSILFAIWFVCEWLIRRRALSAKTHSNTPGAV